MMAPANARPNESPNEPPAEFTPAASLTRSSSIGDRCSVELGHQQAQPRPCDHQRSRRYQPVSPRGTIAISDAMRSPGREAQPDELGRARCTGGHRHVSASPPLADRPLAFYSSTDRQEGDHQDPAEGSARSMPSLHFVGQVNRSRGRRAGGSVRLTIPERSRRRQAITTDSSLSSTRGSSATSRLRSALTTSMRRASGRDGEAHATDPAHEIDPTASARRFTQADDPAVNQGVESPPAAPCRGRDEGRGQSSEARARRSRPEMMIGVRWASVIGGAHRRRTPADRGRTPSSADEVADLAADQDERGGDERLERDRRLDAADRRAQVMDDRRDRHVHQRGVDDEHEHRHGEEHGELLSNVASTAASSVPSLTEPPAPSAS